VIIKQHLTFSKIVTKLQRENIVSQETRFFLSKEGNLRKNNEILRKYNAPTPWLLLLKIKIARIK